MNLNLNIGDIICSVDNEWPKWKYKKLKVISLHRDGQAYLELLEDIYEIKKNFDGNYLDEPGQSVDMLIGWINNNYLTEYLLYYYLKQ